MTVRTSLSVSDNNKYDRNGSLMHTMMDNVDDTSVAPTKMKMLQKKTQDSDEDYALDENYL